MMIVQLVCLAIVVTYVAMRLRDYRREWRAFVVRFVTLAIAAAIGEDTVIRAYHTYAYAPSWSVFIDRVPLVVILVWPVVIDSAAVLVRCVVVPGDRPHLDHSWRVALIAAAIVLADASLIEPIAVRAGLWAWTDPGLFDVPLIGIAGWAMFTFAATAIVEHSRITKTKKKVKMIMTALVIVIAPLVTHMLILASWWVLFRWIQGPIATATSVAIAWVVLAPMTIASWRVALRIPRKTVLARAPGAAFFFGLLLIQDGLSPNGSKSLLLFYALAFAPPYFVVMARRFLAQSRQVPDIAT